MFKKLIVNHLRGKVLPPNAVIEVYRNGFILRDHLKVQNGDTLWLSEVKRGLHGGSMKENSIAPELSAIDETVMDLVMPSTEKGDGIDLQERIRSLFVSLAEN